jgi:hypothetical protein
MRGRLKNSHFKWTKKWGAAHDLFLYRTAPEPECQMEAMCRRKIMRKARSKKRRPQLLAELEHRYFASF